MPEAEPGCCASATHKVAGEEHLIERLAAPVNSQREEQQCCMNQRLRKMRPEQHPYLLQGIASLEYVLPDYFNCNHRFCAHAIIVGT